VDNSQTRGGDVDDDCCATFLKRRITELEQQVTDEQQEMSKLQWRIDDPQNT